MAEANRQAPFETVQVAMRGAVGWCTLHRPERRNAISPQMTKELLAALEALENDEECRAVVLTGSGEKAFCAGGDLGGEVPPSFLERYELQRLFADLFLQLERLTKPVVARVNGYALGGGFGLAAACDIVVAKESASFGTPEIGIGLFPYIIMATLLRVTAHPKRLLQMMLTGEKVKAEEALSLGFVNRVVPDAELDAALEEEVSKLLKMSPAVLRLGRRAFYAAREMEFRQALEYLSSMLAINSNAEDAMEGVMAFVQKREPKWKGK